MHIPFSDFKGQEVIQCTFPDFQEVIVQKSLPEAQYELICARLCDLFKVGVIEDSAGLVKAFEDISYMVKHAECRVRVLPPCAEVVAMPEPIEAKPVGFREMLMRGIGG